MTIKHRDFTGATVHVPYTYTYADATARAAATGFIPADVGKFARQLDDNSIWMLIDDTPETWVRVSDTGIVGAEAFTDLSDVPNDYTGQAGLVVAVNGTEDGLEFVTGGAGGGWDLVIDEDGTSFSNFTAASGSWSSDGTVIKQTDTSATRRKARHNTKIITALCVVECEVQLRTSGGTNQGGIIVGFDGSNAGGAAAFVAEADTVHVESESSVNKYTYSTTINVNTWYKIRVLHTGGVVTVYLDDVLIFSAGNLPNTSNAADYIGLMTYGAEVWFRNYRAWNPAMPA